MTVNGGPTETVGGAVHVHPSIIVSERELTFLLDILTACLLRPSGSHCTRNILVAATTSELFYYYDATARDIFCVSEAIRCYAVPRCARLFSKRQKVDIRLRTRQQVDKKMDNGGLLKIGLNMK